MSRRERPLLRQPLAGGHVLPEGCTRLDAEFDSVVEDIYRTAAGIGKWLDLLERIAALSGAWAVRMLGFDKRTGALTLHCDAGPRPAESAIQYAHSHHKLDPRLAMLSGWPVGRWLASQDHFDDDYVARDPFYQTYLIPYGFRYLYGAKIADDGSSYVLFCHHRPAGDPLVDTRQRHTIERVGRHIGQALEIDRRLPGSVGLGSLGFELLDRVRPPAILIDGQRRISFRCKSAKEIFDRADVICERAGILTCRNDSSDAELALAMNQIRLTRLGSDGPHAACAARRLVRLRDRRGACVGLCTLLALRPPGEHDAASGCVPQVFVAIHGLGATEEVDPLLLEAAFDLTPAEARVAALLAAGRRREEIAAQLRISVATVRTHLHAVFSKTGTTRQAELIRLLLGASLL